jgi:RNA polymerase-binding transcription factor DksA
LDSPIASNDRLRSMTMIGTTKYVTSVHANADERDRDLAQESRSLPTATRGSRRPSRQRSPTRRSADACGRCGEALPDGRLAAAQRVTTCATSAALKYTMTKKLQT